MSIRAPDSGLTMKRCAEAGLRSPRKAALGPYHVVAQLSPRDGQLQYRIKSGFEPFYRTVTENELEPDIGATLTVAAS